MLKFVKQIFISAMMFFGCNSSNVNSFKCVSMNNEEILKFRNIEIIYLRKMGICILKYTAQHWTYCALQYW